MLYRLDDRCRLDVRQMLYRLFNKCYMIIRICYLNVVYQMYVRQMYNKNVCQMLYRLDDMLYE